MITTFGHRQVVWFQTCLNLSTLWLFMIFYCKNFKIYIKNLAQQMFLSKKYFFDIVTVLNWQKLVIRRNIN
jgi:hypothetical protein